ncbi:hypothetical protein SELMODRAFT_444502 [Selaginella moellendorffii]|uniref:Mechanosensitive ion channel protein 2/3 C-terminal domain-containing protein n=1 Tax=Selaginella moellendorffii TaxID=88036 RepID=D8SA70_SELML|nr:hypothetical protein SELMODRAFT_444502 [Selaginella moellendorffii]
MKDSLSLQPAREIVEMPRPSQGISQGNFCVAISSSDVNGTRVERSTFFGSLCCDHRNMPIMVSCFVNTSHYEEYLCVKESAPAQHVFAGPGCSDEATPFQP